VRQLVCGSAGLGRRTAGGTELVRLVDDVRGDLAQLVSVLTGVVGAEEEFSSGLELHTKVGLGSATVATVQSSQGCGTGGNGSSHNGLISVSRCLWPNVVAGDKDSRRHVSPDTSIMECLPRPDGFHASGIIFLGETSCLC
jgi:hypothetical protein